MPALKSKPSVSLRRRKGGVRSIVGVPWTEDLIIKVQPSAEDAEDVSF